MVTDMYIININYINSHPQKCRYNIIVIITTRPISIVKIVITLMSVKVIDRAVV
jgi:hypothetical protein